MKNHIQIEICIDSVESALAAQKGGADRVELCANLFEGGTTPSWGMIKACRKIEGIELYVMIRPRGGDFCYSALEIEVMKEDILMARELKAEGVVLGLLHPSGAIDKEHTRELVDLASPMKVTFHRAFDMCADPLKALDDLMECGIYRLLTSGQEQTAFQGKELIGKLVQYAGNNIRIMVGSGVNAENVEELIRTTGIAECHFSAKSSVPSKMEYRNPRIHMGGIEGITEYETFQSDFQKIQQIRAIVNNI